MKVLMLNYEYPPLGGGAANATRYLLREFRSFEDVHVELVTSSVGAHRVGSVSDAIGIHYLDIGKKGSLHYQTNRNLAVYSWKALAYARRLLRERRFDLCHAFFGVPCGFIAKWLGLPYIVSLRGSDVPFYNERFRHLDRFVFRHLSPWIWSRAARVVANSEELRDLALQSAPNQPIDVIYNGVDTEEFSPGPRDAEGLRVLCVSRLIPRKGIEFLLRALPLLDNAEVRLTIAGTGSQQQELEALAEDLGIRGTVDFRGYVDHDELPPLYRDHDVFVLPSTNEGMSNTALEAMASGLPVILTDTGGAKALLRHGENGFLVRKRSPEDIAEALRTHLSDKTLRAQHGNRSRDIALTKSWRSTAERYAEFYRAVIK